jgi:hypothetical protein
LPSFRADPSVGGGVRNLHLLKYQFVNQISLRRLADRNENQSYFTDL